MSANLRARLARGLERIWWRAKPPPRSLRVLAALYGLSAGRLERPQEKPDCPVIVVGNLTAGGNGKTPVVLAVVEHFLGQGLNPAIITRGYGGTATGTPLLVSADTDSRACGDEARMLANRTVAPVWVCRLRAQALDRAIRSGADLVVSDDGLQHVGLPRSYELCLIDQRRGFGNGRLLPAGPLRQPIERLQSVDRVLYKRDEGSALKPDEWGFELSFDGWFNLQDRPLDPPPSGAKLHAVAGIADPEPFFSGLRSMGYRVQPHALQDHQPIDPDWLLSLAGPVVMTEKDAARLDGRFQADGLWVLRVRAMLPGQLLDELDSHVRKFKS